VAVVFGTRPEAVKLAPVIAGLRADGRFEARVIVTAQHRALLDQTLAAFDIRPDVDLAVERRDGSLAELIAALATPLAAVLEAEAPRIAIVQGDTASTFLGALTAFHAGIPVGHVEAGLRSDDLANPFPEEGYRRMVSQIASRHYAPTSRAVENLRRSGVAPDSIVLTGNTVVDALHWILPRLDAVPPVPRLTDGPRIVVTMHRRENWGEPIANVCRAIVEILGVRPSVEVVVVAHANPLARGPIDRSLAEHPRVQIVDAIDYPRFLALMRSARLILSDSGGVQEEAPAFGVPVLVLRETTERPEAIEAGCARLVGTDADTVATAALALLDDDIAHAVMSRVTNPFGDGRAAGRIVDDLARCLGTGN
jgi:UDP-N-acetylglucosamine 2-epimerase (non-hydrolysing)